MPDIGYAILLSGLISVLLLIFRFVLIEEEESIHKTSIS